MSAVRPGNRGCELHGATKVGKQKTGKMFNGLMSVYSCCDIQIVRSEFGLNDVSVVQVVGGVKVWGYIFLAKKIYPTPEYCC